MPAMASINPPRIALLLFIVMAAACSGKSGEPASSTAPPKPGGVASLQSVALKPGTGAAVANGQIAVVQYTGWLYDASATDNKGQEFDSSRNAHQAFKFPLGTGSVIKGWDQGVAGMKLGESRRLIIPPGLAYGDNG